jgi:hypothetical protein
LKKAAQKHSSRLSRDFETPSAQGTKPFWFLFFRKRTVSFQPKASSTDADWRMRGRSYGIEVKTIHRSKLKTIKEFDNNELFYYRQIT